VLRQAAREPPCVPSPAPGCAHPLICLSLQWLLWRKNNAGLLADVVCFQLWCAHGCGVLTDALHSWIHLRQSDAHRPGKILFCPSLVPCNVICSPRHLQALPRHFLISRRGIKEVYRAAERSGRGVQMWVRGCACVSPHMCSLLLFPNGVFSAHVSELPLTGQAPHTAGIPFIGLFSQSYTQKSYTFTEHRTWILSHLEIRAGKRPSDLYENCREE